jgi:hypothetical protein
VVRTAVGGGGGRHVPNDSLAARISRRDGGRAVGCGSEYSAKDESDVDSKSRAYHPGPAISAHVTDLLSKVDAGVFAAAKRHVTLRYCC